MKLSTNMTPPYILLAASLFGQTFAHSWIEQMVNINSTGAYVGEFGYARSFSDKGLPGFDQNSNLYMLPPIATQPPVINSSQFLCHPSQRTQTQSANYPRLQVEPGNFFALKYAENGHVTQPDQLPGKPKFAGTTFVFGTTQPKEDEKIVDVLQWTKDGSGGDKRGVILAAENFDDGRCYQLKAGNAISEERQQKFPDPIQGQPGSQHEQLCETDVQLPEDAPVGKAYTLYWVWQWPTEGGHDPSLPNGKDEYYITCMDVDVVKSVNEDVKPSHTLAQPDPQGTAVSDYQSRTALVSDPIKGEIGTAVFSNQPASATKPVTASATDSTKASATAQRSTTPASVITTIPAITESPRYQTTGGNEGEADAVTITVTEQVTVTAPLTIATVAARGISFEDDNHARTISHLARHGSAKFRGRL